MKLKFFELLRKLFRQPPVAPVHIPPSPLVACIAVKCGHEINPSQTSITVFGEKIQINIEAFLQNKAYCPDCIAKMSTRCTRCGKHILPYTMVTFSEPLLETPGIEKYINGYYPAEGQEVGCSRLGCIESMGNIIGVWVPPGCIKIANSSVNPKSVLRELSAARSKAA